MSATDQYNKLSHDRNLKIKHLKVNSRNPNGETVLHIACRMNDVTSAARLINAGAKTTKKDQNGDIALHIAVRNGNPDIVKLFLPKSGEVQSSQLKDLVNNEGETALHIAASMGHAHIIKDLILAGWNPNVRDKCGRTYIHHACSRGFGPSVIKQLKPYRHNKQDTSSNEIHAIEWVFNCTDNDGKTPLHYACEAGSMELVEELCKLGEDPKFEDQKLMTKNDGGCLHLAASSGCINLVLFLIETCHIDPSLKGHYGENILHRACANGRTELVQKLIEKKYADIHAQDAIGLTPLHWAMINQQNTIAHILVNDHDCSLLSTCDVKSILESGLPSKYYFEREKLLEAFMLISINDRMNSGKEPHELEKKEEEGLKKSKSCSDLRHSGKPKESVHPYDKKPVELKILDLIPIHDWKALGLQLDVKLTDLDEIEAYNKSGKECTRQMYSLWLRNTREASYRDLKKAFEKLKYAEPLKQLNELLFSCVGDPHS